MTARAVEALRAALGALDRIDAWLKVRSGGTGLMPDELRISQEARAALSAHDAASMTAPDLPALPEPAYPLVDVLAKWEDQNGTMAAVLPSEWDSLRQDVMDACVIQSPRMLREAIAAKDAEIARLSAALAAQQPAAVPYAWVYWHPSDTTFDGPDARRKEAVSKFTDDTRAAMEKQGWFFRPLFAAAPAVQPAHVCANGMTLAQMAAAIEHLPDPWCERATEAKGQPARDWKAEFGEMQARCADLETELRALKKEQPAEAVAPKPEKTAPVQGWPQGIPWSLHLEAYAAYCKKWSPQPALIDLEDRNCRGGFGTEELDEFIPGWRDKVSEIGRLKAEVARLSAALAAPTAAPSAQPVAQFRTAKQAGVIAGDGKACPNDHDPDCRWPECNCRAAAPSAPQPSGHCTRGDGCVCGGDTVAVRAACRHWETETKGDAA